MTVHIDGDTDAGAARRRAKEWGRKRHLDEDSLRALGDRAVYHSGVYKSSVGLELNGEMLCVGCWWCSGPRTAAHGEPDLPL